MKKILITAAFVAVAIPAFAQTSSWTAPYEPFHVIDNVYYVGSAGLSAWLITTPQGNILLDVGMPANAEMVEQHIAKLGFKVADTKILLNSHCHIDHAGGLAKLKADTGATVMLSEKDAPYVASGVYPGNEARGSSFKGVAADKIVHDGDKITLGGTTLTAMITPGHSPGCTSYLMPVKDAQGRPHTIFFFCSATVAANRLAPKPSYPGIVDDYRQTFARVKTVKADIYLAPHAEFYDLNGKRAALAAGNANAFVKPGEVQTAIAKFETDFDKGLAEQQAKAKG